MRDDSLGLFWEDVQTKQKGNVYARPIPAIPDTGWVAPAEFPRLADAKLLGLDCETKDISLVEKGPGFRRTGDEGAYIVGIAVGTPDGGRWYFPMRHSIAAEQNLNPDAVLAWARDNLCSPGQVKVGANLSYDVDALWSEGVPVTGPFIDVQHAEALLDPNRYTFNLEALGRSYVGEGKVSTDLRDWVERAYGQDGSYRAHIHAAPPCLVGPYAEGDVDLPLRIWEKQRVLLEQQLMMGLFDLETELIPLMVEMRQNGVRVDLAYARQLDVELTEAMADLDAKLAAVAGRPIDVDSRNDLAVLFDAAGVPYPRTPTGQPSFVKEWLSNLAHPAGELIRQRRQVQKYRNTFIRSYILDKHINGRIYALFHQLKGDDNGAISGRFSSSIPNLQNIPARDRYWGPKLRALFIPEDGEEWMAHDWSQIEYRFLGHYARGPSGKVVRQMYNENPDTDFHEMVLDMVAPVIGWDVSTPEERAFRRRPIKNVNFGLCYGMGVPLLASQLGLAKDPADRLFRGYHKAVPFVKATAEAASAQAQNVGHIKTVLGRRARFDLYEPKWGRGDVGKSRALPYTQAVEAYGSKVVRAFTHKALNALLQGSAADLMKLAMRDIGRAGVSKYIGTMLLTCHDETGHSINRQSKAAIEAAGEVKRIMETCMTLRVPVVAEQSFGTNWGTAKK
jgi:DNA polymerase I-like protein with 3'-5' exonuclease and polymerase domains